MVEVEKILQILQAFLPGIITTLALLPITSDLLREKIFGPKSRRLASAQHELASVLKEMLFSGQHIDDSTYQKISQNIAEKHKVAPSLLGDKDNAISSLLQMINLTEGLPKKIKRELSNALKREYSDFKEIPVANSADDKYAYSCVEDFEEMLINKWAEYSNDNQTYNIVGDDRIQRKATLLASNISLLFGLLVGVIAFSVDKLFWVSMVKVIPALLAFLLCVSILISLIDSKVLKDIEYFRKLVYKIIFLMVLLVTEIVLSIVL